MKVDKALIKKLLEETDKEEQELQHTVSEFDDLREGGISSIANTNQWEEKMTNLVKKQAMSDEEKEQAINYCRGILNNVKSHVAGNLEVNLAQGTQKYEGCEQELGATIIKVVPANDDIPIYFFWDKQNVLDCLIFIGGSERKAFLAIKDVDNNLSIVKLTAFYLLSIREKTKPNQEVGLLTSFSWYTTKICSSVLIGNNLLPLKTLFLVDAFRNWESENEEETGEKKESRSASAIA